MKLGGHFIVSFFLLFGALQAEPYVQTWDYASFPSTPDNWGGLRTSVKPAIKTPDGHASLYCVPDYGNEDLVWSPHLLYSIHSKLVRDSKTVEVSFWIRGEAGAQITLRFTSSDDMIHYTPTRSYDLTGGWQKIVFRENLQGPIIGKWLNAPRLLLSKVKAGQQFFIGPLVFKAD